MARSTTSKMMLTTKLKGIFEVHNTRCQTALTARITPTGVAKNAPIPPRVFLIRLIL